MHLQNTHWSTHAPTKHSHQHGQTDVNEEVKAVRISKQRVPNSQDICNTQHDQITNHFAMATYMYYCTDEAAKVARLVNIRSQIQNAHTLAVTTCNTQSLIITPSTVLWQLESRVTCSWFAGYHSNLLLMENLLTNTFFLHTNNLMTIKSINSFAVVQSMTKSQLNNHEIIKTYFALEMEKLLRGLVPKRQTTFMTNEVAGTQLICCLLWCWLLTLPNLLIIRKDTRAASSTLQCHHLFTLLKLWKRGTMWSTKMCFIHYRARKSIFRQVDCHVH